MAHIDETSLFSRIGGTAAVDATVDVFYKKIVADPGLSRFFEGIDMVKLKGHQARFMATAFGSPGKYTGRSIAAVHKNLIENHGLGTSHFDMVAGHLVSSLQELGVAQALIDEVVAVVGPLRSIFEAPAPKAEEALKVDDNSLFVRIGGDAAVAATVEVFYKKLLVDPGLARFFEGIDITKLKNHQTRFMATAFGGPGKYTGRSIAAVHKNMIEKQGLGTAHFDMVAGHLVGSLQELGVAQTLIDEVVAVVGPLRSIFEAPAPKAVEEQLQALKVDDDSLFARIGGDAAVEATVDVFYKKVVADPGLARFFENTDMAKLKIHQTRFMATAFGGPGKYTGRSIAAVHKNMIEKQGLGTAHFDMVAGHLVGSLQELGVAHALIDEVVAVVGPLRSIFEAPAPIA